MTTTRLPDRRYGGYVFDLDGTLYLGDHLIPGPPRRSRASGRMGPGHCSSRTTRRLPADYAGKLRDLGIPAQREDVVSSIDALVDYLAVMRRCLAHGHHRPLSEFCSPARARLTEDPDRTDGVVVAWIGTFDYAS